MAGSGSASGLRPLPPRPVGSVAGSGGTATASDPARLRKWRNRESWSACLSVRLGGLLDCFANAYIGPAAADIAGHRVVDVGIRRTRVAREQRRSGHDLARLAVAALRDLAVEPGLLDLGAPRCRADCLDGRDLGAADAVDGSDAGTSGDSVHMHGASAAERHAAAKLRASHAKHVAQHPQKRSITVNVDRTIDAVDLNRGGHSYLPAASRPAYAGRPLVRR